MPNDDELSPALIRGLRGSRTRAAFATELGVNAHTIYRWELPEDSAHARRPRGEVARRLTALAQRAPAPPADRDDATGLAVMAAMQRMLDGDWHDAERSFLRAMSAREASVDARALASTGLALIELLYRADNRRALAALAPALASGQPLALTEAAAALAYSFPDGELFDLGRVHAHTMRAEELARAADSPTALALIVVAEINAALLAGDDDLMLRGLARVDQIAIVALPEIPRLCVEQLRALSATYSAHARLGIERLERMLDDPKLPLCPPLHARICAMLALRQLDALGAPEPALALARRSRELAEHARLALGVHTALALRAESEALMRLGRLPEAAAVFAEGDRIFDEHRFPVTTIIASQSRYLLTTAQPEGLDALADRLASIELPSMRAVCQAYAAWLRATASLARGDDGAELLERFAHAERLAGRWGFLLRDLMVQYAGAAILNAEPAVARAIVLRANRAAERIPTAWTAAHLRRTQATLLLLEGKADEGLAMFEAAVATFAAAGDRLDAALAGYGAAGIARALGDPQGDAKVAAATTELVTMGLPLPGWITRAFAKAERAYGGGPIAMPTISSDATPRALGLEVALQRLAVPGASPAMVMRELVAVVSGLAGASVVVEESGRVVAGDARATPCTWLELGDGVGRRLRLGVGKREGGQSPTDAERAALRVIALVAGLALEVAALRNGEGFAAAPDAVPEVAGLVAASGPMRRLVADLGRLAGSRATVVITGESGTGKEVIAHALHTLSPRGSQSLVAFNCAAVPHDLFEGQLFGYRKGAFTGAAGDHPGVIRAADGGTLFLDEIGELPLDIQPKLLRFLENGEVFPLGAQRPVTVDVRVIAATNRDLASEVRRGRFREDLYYRLQVVPLLVPPLRDRKDDIPPLARHFARQLAAEDGGRPPAFTPDALALLTAHPWPGNVRELRNVIARAMAYAPRPEVITRAQLGL
ncbi:MAG: sigma-54 dependent transcriptional regulator [Deltaproteobacteria bacterium]|nr:sigma-54 dependent transcriptional regulator [Deltaproteobacteria bacterium]